ncbi:MAG: GNAT family N-acetyltransferase [Negativicutes bacterium]|nr:GNAT family N-acetyltransferase [Negativicutes bacterium]
MSLIYKEINQEDYQKIIRRFGSWVEQLACIHRQENAFSLAAFDQEEPIGFISTCAKAFPAPLASIGDAFIDVIEVDAAYRRQGVARSFVTMTESWAREQEFRQIRAWSQRSQSEALAMWLALDYCLCPAVIQTEGNQEIIEGFYAVKNLRAKLY